MVPLKNLRGGCEIKRSQAESLKEGKAKGSKPQLAKEPLNSFRLPLSWSLRAIYDLM